MLHATNHIPSTAFYRRLILIGSVLVLIVIGLIVRTAHLTIAQGGELRDQAESALIDHVFLPTTRGQITDRHGRVLARDRAGVVVAVHYAAIDGRWVEQQASAAAREAVGDAAWDTMPAEERDEAIARQREVLARSLDLLWGDLARAAGVDREYLEKRRNAIWRRTKKMADSVARARIAEERRKYGDEAAENYVSAPLLEETIHHPILEVGDETAAPLRMLAESSEGLIDVRFERTRTYPVRDTPTAVHVDRSTFPSPLVEGSGGPFPVSDCMQLLVGSMRTVDRREIEARAFRDPASGLIDLGGYRVDGDSVGGRGAEAAAEARLRGRYGQRTLRMSTGETDVQAPVAGDDVALTIDLALQKRVHALLLPDVGLTRVCAFHEHPILPVGTPLDSTAVVIDIESREVLAMASYPAPASIGDDDKELRYFLHRAIERAYAPGSIIKPLVLASAVASHKHELGEAIECKGHFFEHNLSTARCWIYRSFGDVHGHLHGDEAITRSCNIFFYTLAARMGTTRMCRLYETLGVGRRLETGLLWDASRADGTRYRTGIVPGALPDPIAIAASGARQYNTIVLGIGQGPVTWTPLHAANAYATLASGGRLMDPILLRAPGSMPPPVSDMGLDRAAVGKALDGLYGCVTDADAGTGHHFYVEVEDGERRETIFDHDAFAVWGKTGTAQTGIADFPFDVPLDPDGDGKIDPPTHAWFVGMFGDQGSKRPRYAVAVLVEFGGSGGRVAGPIANQIGHALLAEGYLQRREPTP